MIAWVPGAVAENVAILRRLQHQKPSLKTSLWRINICGPGSRKGIPVCPGSGRCFGQGSEGSETQAVLQRATAVFKQTGGREDEAEGPFALLHKYDYRAVLSENSTVKRPLT
jgi:hypothetical protein